MMIAAVSDGQWVQVAGLLMVHHSPPTAKGFHFLTLEDENGIMNFNISPDVYGRYRPIIRSERRLLAKGQVQQQDGVTNLLAERVAAL